MVWSATDQPIEIYIHVAWLTHAAIGDHVSMFGDFAATTFTGGIAYVAAYYYLKKLRG